MVKQYTITITIEEVPKTIELQDLVLEKLEKTAVTANLADNLASWEKEVELISSYWISDIDNGFDLFKESLTLNDLCKMHRGKLFNDDGSYVGDENIIIRDVGNCLVIYTFNDYVTEIKSLIKEDSYTDWALKMLLEDFL